MSDSDYVDVDEKIEKMEKTLQKYSKYISELQAVIDQLQKKTKSTTSGNTSPQE